MVDLKPLFRVWYGWLTNLKVEDIFSRKRESGPQRTVYVNERLPDDYSLKGKIKSEHIYSTNQVITSKYTLITFLPRNLLEQFRRIANIFFLFIAVLQFFNKFSTISPGVVILPLLIILAITALKDGYEDFKRHQSDRQVNYNQVLVLSGGNWTNPNSMTRKSGTSIRAVLPKPTTKSVTVIDVKKGPLEIEVFSLSQQPNFKESQSDTAKGEGKVHWSSTSWKDVCVGDFVQIANNQAIPADLLICATSEEDNIAFVETMNLDGETNLKSRHAVAALSHLKDATDCANPANMFKINCDRPDVDMYRLNGNVVVKGQTMPFDLSMTLLRGTVLKNTGWVIGIVLFTGLDTKIIMNSGGTPSKRSKVERQMNPQVLVNLIILATLATACAIADSLLERHYFPLGAPWLFEDDRKGDNPKINGLITWVFALLTFQDIVPISLYISIEVVRTCQAAFIYFDYDMWCAKTNQATIARSWNLSDDLGQIEYIFSDKTGTLTQNLMIFRQCSIGGRVYRGSWGASSLEQLQLDEKSKNSPYVYAKGKPDRMVINELPVEYNSPASSSYIAFALPNEPKKLGGDDARSHFSDMDLKRDIEEAIAVNRCPPHAAHARALNVFFTVLALCHTAVAATDPNTGEVKYEAQSPDEAALVQAAADVGFVFLIRTRDTLSLRTPLSPDVQQFKLLNILEFTSTRKRMSIVVRIMDENDHRIMLLMKGADNVIFERLERESEEDGLKQETENHLNEFANSGLRTLTLAYKIISEEFYEAWSERYREATVAMENREERIESVSNEIEQNLMLLGATAIEDRLQDGVPETISDLKRAGIKIWVVTGDKLETAIAIGRSTNLITQDSNIIIIRGGRRSVEEQISAAVEQFFPGSYLENADLYKSNSRSDETAGVIPLRRVNTGVSSIVGSGNGHRSGGFALVIDGAALLDVFADDRSKMKLLKLAMLCEGVICCRVSPLQKALVVRLVKDGLGVVTLAIGDGANDVSMIQAADVGIGINGVEGMQAVNSSDYAIVQFKFLKKLLLVHGHWSYSRNGTMILNFFYKNMVPIGMLWWFQIYDAWSANFVFDYTYVLFWNSLWTIAPVVGIGLFDRFLDADALMQLPELYRFGREGRWFSLKSFFVFIFDGIIQSTIIFFVILYTYDTTTTRVDGYDIRQSEFSTTMAISGVMVANIFTGLSATAWTAWLSFTILIGIAIVWVFTAIYSAIAPGYAVTNLYGNDVLLFHSSYFWLGLLLTFTLALAPRYIAKAWKSSYRPDDIDVIRWIQKQEPGRDLSRYSGARREKEVAIRDSIQLGGLSSAPRHSVDTVLPVDDPFRRPFVDVCLASTTDMSTGLIAVDRGFDFATEEHGVQIQRIQTNLSEGQASSRHLPPPKSITGKGKERLSHMFSLRRHRKKGASRKETS